MTIAAKHAAAARDTGAARLHAYFVEEARRALSGGSVYHHKDHLTQPEEFQSSACFDAWAKDDEPAGTPPR